jgi:hypothetical protein
MVSEPKVMAPVLVRRLTPVLPDSVTEVLPKLRAPLDVLTLMPMPLGAVIVVDGEVRLPPTLVRLMPVVALVADEMLPKVAASVPVVRFSA